jgi:uncharacterized protein YidB (DUF937 family)
MGLLDQILGSLATGQGGPGNGPGGGRGSGQGGGGLADVLGQILGQGQRQSGGATGGGLGDVLGNVLGGGRQSGGNPGDSLGGLNPILMAVLGMLASRAIGGMMNRGAGSPPTDASPAPGGDGLDGLREAFQRGGMGSAFDSWVGTGRNEPPDEASLQQMLGQDRIAEIARQLGISESEATHQVAEVMPDVVDRLTPDGRLPANGFGDMGSMLERLLRGGR